MATKQNYSVKNKLVLLTGATGGIGKALAYELVKKGARLIVTYRHPDLLRNLGTLTIEHSYPLDLNSASSIETLVLNLKKDDRVPDILINNAGIGQLGLLETQDLGELDDMIQINLAAPIKLTRLLLPLMLAKKSEMIINQASINAYLYTPTASVYCASKAGLAAFTKALEYELRDTGVTTLLLITEPVRTEMQKQSTAVAQQYFKLASPQVQNPEVYAKEIVQAIESKASERYPSGSLRRILWLNRLLPGLQKRIFEKSFSRYGSAK